MDSKVIGLGCYQFFLFNKEKSLCCQEIHLLVWGCARLCGGDVISGAALCGACVKPESIPAGVYVAAVVINGQPATINVVGENGQPVIVYASTGTEKIYFSGCAGGEKAN